MYGAVVLAGGRGERFHGQKQFFELDGRPLWKIVRDKALEAVGQNTVTVGVDMQGGETRSESVIIGLHALDSRTQRVILLEAARPLVTKQQILTLLEDPYDSSSFVMPLVNTAIMRDGTYLNRNEMYELLTPQAFDFQKLKKAYDSGNFPDMTDETRVMWEYYGIRPHFIETTENLVKVTYRKDISILKELIKQNYE